MDKPSIPCNSSHRAAGAPSKAASSWKSASPNKLIIETGTNGTIKGRGEGKKKKKKRGKSLCISRDSLFSSKNHSQALIYRELLLKWDF